MFINQRVRISYSPLVADRICQHILEGKSLRQIEQLPDMPAARSVYRWLEVNLEFRTHYQLVRELWAHDFLVEIRQLVDGEIIPWPEEQQSTWLERINSMVQARWRTYHRLVPKKYRLFLGPNSYGLPPAPSEVTEDISHEVVQPLRISC